MKEQERLPRRPKAAKSYTENMKYGVILLVLALSACGGTVGSQSQESDFPGTEVFVRDEFGNRLSLDTKFKLVAKIESPEIGGQRVQATSVSLSKTFALISFNLAGEQLGGAVQVFDISKETQPKLLQERLFKDVDVNSVDSSESSMFITGVDSEGAYLSRFEFKSDSGYFSEKDERQALPSFAGTELAIHKYGFASSGDRGGGITVFDRRDGKLMRFVELQDTRSITLSCDKKYLYALSGEKGTIYKFNVKALVDGEDALENKQDYDEEITPEAKATISAGKEYSVISLHEKGMEIICNEDLRPLASTEPAGKVTNAAALYKDYVFAAEGDRGVWAYKMEKDKSLGESKCGRYELKRLGYLDLSDSSTNHIVVRDSYLFVATGSGLKVISMDD